MSDNRKVGLSTPRAQGAVLPWPAQRLAAGPRRLAGAEACFFSGRLLSTLASYVAAMGERPRLVAEFPDRPPVELTGIGGESEGKAAREGRGHKMPRAAAVHSGTTGAPTGPMKIRAKPAHSPNDG